MRFLYPALFLATFGVSAVLGQQRPPNQATAVPRADFAIGYNYIGANAPPGGCACFGLNGGFVSGSVQLTDWLGFTGKITADHADDISLLGQNLTLTTLMAGPKVSLPHHRVVPFAEILLGGARGTGSYFPSGTSSSSSASSFALSTGGGLDVNLTHRFAIRALDVQYLRTTLPNGTGNTQNQLEIGVGLVVKFGGHTEPQVTQAAPRQEAEFEFNCSVASTEVTEGDPVQIVGQTVTLPDKLDINYAWTTSGGKIQGEGRVIKIDTTDLPAGSYQVTGHATLVSDSTVGEDCTASFKVNKKMEAKLENEAANTAPPLADNSRERDFREHVKDAFFNYDSDQLRPDAREAVAEDALYLNAHPDLQITIAGYADERGSAEYNLALGLNRATAARDALVGAGLPLSRMQVITYGKEKPFCTDTTESCYQQNRRAQLTLDK